MITTTRLTYNLQHIYDDQIAALDLTPEPYIDGMQQFYVFLDSFDVLGAHVGKSPDVFQSSNSFICYDPSDLNIRVAPDYYVAFGVDAKAIDDREVYLPWEVGKAPDFVLEVASKSTARRDTTSKRDIYQRIGVTEYWRFDHTGGDYYGVALAGDRLVEGEYESIELTTEPDGVLKGYSRVLDINLAWRDGDLRLYSDKTGAYLPNFAETHLALEVNQAALESVEYAREAAETARKSTDAALASSESKRIDAEARIKELEEEIRRLRDESQSE